MKWTAFVDETLPPVTFFRTIDDALAAQDDYTRQMYFSIRDYAKQNDILRVTIEMGKMTPAEAESAYQAVRRLSRVEVRRRQWETAEGIQESRGSLLGINLAITADGVPESVEVDVWELYPEPEWSDL